MIPYFSFLNYKDSDYQQDNGYISNIQVNGDNQPLTVMVSGPNGYTAGPFVTPSVIPTLNNLEPGTYILNVTNAIGENSTLEIIIAELPETVLVSDFGDPCNCSDCNCTLSILSYTHNSDCFTYNLYKDGVIIDTYTGCTGSEIHTFTDLCNGQYTVEAVENDVLVHTYSNSGGCEEGSISFDET